MTESESQTSIFEDARNDCGIANHSGVADDRTSVGTPMARCRRSGFDGGASGGMLTKTDREAPVPFQKIVACKISSAVTRQIEELILQGVLRPGDRLPAERELSETMDVSRPTLREALADLEERGLIATRPGGGTFIAEVLGSAFAAPLIELFATHDTALFD